MEGSWRKNIKSEIQIKKKRIMKTELRGKGGLKDISE
jgi:hypothetical protein